MKSFKQTFIMYRVNKCYTSFVFMNWIMEQTVAYCDLVFHYHQLLVCFHGFPVFADCFGCWFLFFWTQLSCRLAIFWVVPHFILIIIIIIFLGVMDRIPDPQNEKISIKVKSSEWQRPGVICVGFLDIGHLATCDDVCFKGVIWRC